MHVARHRTDTSSWWIRPRALAALVAASAGLVVAIALPGRNDVAAANEHRPVFADDFGDRRGASIDRSRWLLDGDDDAARQDGDGNLVTTRLIGTKTAFAEPFGHAEARIKVRRDRGPWRAFGVVDKYGRVLRGEVETLDRSADPTSGRNFHTYAIDWSPESVLWSVDGKPALRLTPEEPGLPISLVLNLATDGRRPARMVVDFVRVSAGRKAPAPTPTATEEPPASEEPPATEEPTSAPTTEPTTAPTTTPPPPPATTTPPPAPTTPPAPKATPWKPFTLYTAGDLVTFGGATYRVKELHTSLPGWEPTKLPTLFQKI
ncbi:MAG: carbohydrate-binding protein [Actinoplanes sp.]